MPMTHSADQSPHSKAAVSPLPYTDVKTDLACATSAAVAVGARRDAGDGFEDFGEVALALIADHRGDLDNRQRRFDKQAPRFFDSQVSQINVRRRAGDLFEQARKVILR